MDMYKLTQKSHFALCFSITCLSITCFFGYSHTSHAQDGHTLAAPAKDVRFVKQSPVKLKTPYTNNKHTALTFDAAYVQKELQKKGLPSNGAISEKEVAEFALEWAKMRCERYSSDEKAALVQQKDILRMYAWGGEPAELKKDIYLPEEMLSLKQQTFPGNLAVMTYYKRKHVMDCKSVGFESFYGLIGPGVGLQEIRDQRNNGNPLLEGVVFTSHYSDLEPGVYKGVYNARSTCEPRPDDERIVLHGIVSCYEKAETLLDKQGRDETLVSYSKRKALGRASLEECAKLVETARKHSPEIAETVFNKPDPAKVCQKLEI